jgi:hypothetical protein
VRPLQAAIKAIANNDLLTLGSGLFDLDFAGMEVSWWFLSEKMGAA